MSEADPHLANRNQPMRVFVLRGVDGAGGGADKIILRNGASVDRSQVIMRVCFLKHVDDSLFDLDRRAADSNIDCVIVEHRGPADRSLLPKLHQLVGRFEPDLVHSHDYKASFYATWLARRRQIPRLATAHGWTGATWREKAIYYPADKWQLRFFDGVIAVSDEIRRTLLRWGAKPERVHVLLNGVDPQHYRHDPAMREEQRARWGFAPNDWVIGGVGRVEQQKRFDLLVDAFSRVLQELPQARLVIAGDGSLLPALRDEIQRRGLQHQCLLTGHCPHMRDAYQALDVLAQSSDYEGTPTVVVEAMACEVPIAATDVGGTGQLMQHERHGLLVPRRNPAALAEAILRLYRHPSERAAFVARARGRVESELTYAHRTEKLVAIYRSLIHKSRSGR